MENQEYTKSFWFVAKIRQLCGLRSYNAVPTVCRDCEDLEGSCGSYSSHLHRVFLGETAGKDVVWHEMCHAHQRVYLRSSECWVYRDETPYYQRWYEKEARAIAILCQLYLDGMEIRKGDHLRINDQGWNIKYSRSLRLRKNRI